MKISHFLLSAQLAMVVEYSDCISAEGEETPNESPSYDYKLSYGKFPVRETSGKWNTSS